MEIKIFGKSLFEYRKNAVDYLVNTNPAIKESKFLPDFYMSHNSLEVVSNWVVEQIDNGGTIEIPKKEEKEPAKKLTPKEVYSLQMLNDKSFSIKIDSVYLDNQIQGFKDKLSMIKAEEFDMSRGAREISSIVIRLENRRKYAEFKDFFEQYPYTSTDKIEGLVKKHNYLQLGQVAQFLADMPNEAIETMKEYTKNTEKLCNKKPVFYIIADKKDFEKTSKRRDPILLAQSPFGHFWQILGAWDKEMLLIDEL